MIDTQILSLFALGVGIGAFGTLIGVGGGLPTHISTATSHFILVFSSLVGSSTHALLGNVNLDFAILMGLGAVIGAQFGALISRITKGTIIERLLGLALIIVAVRFLLQAL